MDAERGPAQVFAGYVDKRRDDSVPARDAVIVRSTPELPTIVGQWHLGDVNGCLFEGNDVDVAPYTREPAQDNDVTADSGLVVGHVLTGSIQIKQDRRAVTLRSGQVAFYDDAAPCTLRSDTSHRYFVAHVRGQALAFRDRPGHRRRPDLRDGR
ncbi:hypothetical protein [Actinomadura madurae]|uniref:hypothetical protein n=1 Tax=Actinomadura madurae TaxID=1993 RepID=UPI000D8C81A2|nr:hypothetical protein [Actinomadura madurae]SPT57987.1 Uncharacterised protein [Actinomadura madurae]